MLGHPSGQGLSLTGHVCGLVFRGQKPNFYWSSPCSPAAGQDHLENLQDTLAHYRARGMEEVLVPRAWAGVGIAACSQQS